LISSIGLGTTLCRWFMINNQGQLINKNAKIMIWVLSAGVTLALISSVIFVYIGIVDPQLSIDNITAPRHKVNRNIILSTSLSAIFGFIVGGMWAAMPNKAHTTARSALLKRALLGEVDAAKQLALFVLIIILTVLLFESIKTTKNIVLLLTCLMGSLASGYFTYISIKSYVAVIGQLSSLVDGHTTEAESSSLNPYMGTDTFFYQSMILSSFLLVAGFIILIVYLLYRP
jgi:hypothetical protein